MNPLPQRPNRCLITGAGGFIGSRLCERFDAQGVQPYRPMLRSAAAAAGWAARGGTPAIGDLLDAPRLRQALQGCDAVIHLAQGDRGPLMTRRLVDAAIAGGVRLFVHISTMSVHGPAPGPEAAHEHTARIGRYDHDYSDSKAEQEEAVQAAHDRGDLRVVILRPTVVYGPRSHFVMQVVEQARGGRVSWFDQGSGICNAVYVDDVCDAIDAALITPAAIGQAMFVNADQPVSWQTFISTFASMVSPAPRFENLSSADALAYWAAHPPEPRGGLARRIARALKRRAGWTPPAPPWPPAGRVLRETFPIHFSNQKARHVLGWAPKHDFASGAALTHQWLAAEGALS